MFSTQPCRTIFARFSLPGTRTLFAISASILFLVLLQFAGRAFANGADMAQAKRDYQTERARCLQAPASDDRAACLQSAGAALQAASQGQLDVASHPYEENKLLRCNAFTGEDHVACVLRMNGTGKVTGSAAQGGDVRQLTTIEIQPATTGDK
jgi:hypothetical protein